MKQCCETELQKQEMQLLDRSFMTEGKLSTKLQENEMMTEIQVSSFKRKKQVHIMSTRLYSPLC